MIFYEVLSFTRSFLIDNIAVPLANLYTKVFVEVARSAITKHIQDVIEI